MLESRRLWRTRRAATLVLWLLGCTIPRAAWAGPSDEPVAVGREAAASPAAEADPLGEESLLFAEIPSVFSASKYEQKVTEAPSAVSIVTADEIRKYGYQSLEEVLNSLPGMFTTNDRNYGYLNVRGFGVAGDYNTRVLLLVDGHRMNDAVFDSALIDRGFPLDVGLIEQIEVVRGPASSLYGTNAFFAVVNVVTKDGRDLGGAELAGTGGSHASYSGRSSWGTRLANGVEVLASAGHYASDHQRHLYYPEFDVPGVSSGVAHDADGEQDSEFFTKVRWQRLTVQAGYGSRDKEIPTAAYDTVFDTSRTQTTDRLAWLDARYDWELPGGWSLESRAYLDSYYYTGDYLYDYSEPGAPLFDVFEDPAHGDRWGSELLLSGDPHPRHHLTTGAEVVHNFRQDMGGFDSFDTYLDVREHSVDWGVFVQDEIRLLDRLTLIAGLRHDEDDFAGGSTNPRVALVYQVADPTVLKLLYGEAYRAPNVYELFYAGGGFKPAGTLDPETIRTVELVGEHEIRRWLRFVGSVYHSDIRNLIALVEDPTDGLLTYRNVSDSESMGLELRLEGQWQSGWRGGLSWSLQRAEDGDTGQRLTNSPRQIAKLNLIAPVVRERLFAGLELQYLGERSTLAGDEAKDFVVTNLTLTAPRLIRGVELQASVRNLFDVRYFHPASEEHLQSRIEQDGRTLFAGLRYAF